MSTIHDVARLADVASVTVSRYLNSNAPVSAAARRRIEAAIAELGYVPNALAQGLKSRATHTLGLVVSDVTNPFFTTIARAVEDTAQAAGYSLILCNTDEDPEKQRLYLDVLRRKRIDGILIAPASDDGASILDWRRHCGPVCVLDRTLQQQADTASAEIDTVRGDSTEAACRLVAHLVEHGHRRIAVITGPEHISTATERLEGYGQALSEAGIPLDPTLIQRCPFRVESGYAAADALLQQAQPPTAFFAANNFLTIGVLAAIRNRGLVVPRDIAVVDFDEIPQIALVLPFLTVAAQAVQEIGRQGATYLLERLARLRSHETAPLPGRELVLPTEIIIRQSCGCHAD
jgi:LacI family transcriptional regulator